MLEVRRIKLETSASGAVAQGARIPNSSGDEAGVNGGVVSGGNMGPAEPKVFVAP